MEKRRIIEIKKITDEVSPTFCLAKWHHTTIYLQLGETHSCYHPAPHKIPLDEIKTNPAALHNTKQKKYERLQMLNGEKPEGCKYCWNIESMGEEYVSDRHIRNSSIYTKERMKEIMDAPPDFDINPEYIEISFGNECNFKCGYCHPKASSSFYKEIEQFGPYKTTTARKHLTDIDWFQIYQKEEENPYVDAWWQWWPQIRQTLNILRITGGEPLLQQSTWKLLDELEQNPCPHLELNINSNLGVKTVLVERLADKINALLEGKKIKAFKLFTSLDTWGDRAEYIRTGLDLEVWEKNFDTYLTKTNQPITFMVTFNLLTVSNFVLLLQKFLTWRKKYNAGEQRIQFDTPYLKEPLHYDMNILPKDIFMPFMYASLGYIEGNLDDADINKFSQLEYEKFLRVVKYMETTEYSNKKVTDGRKDFYNWFVEYDKRRNVNLLKTFPELKSFWEICEGLVKNESS